MVAVSNASHIRALHGQHATCVPLPGGTRARACACRADAGVRGAGLPLLALRATSLLYTSTVLHRKIPTFLAWRWPLSSGLEAPAQKDNNTRNFLTLIVTHCTHVCFIHSFARQARVEEPHPHTTHTHLVDRDDVVPAGDGDGRGHDSGHLGLLGNNTDSLQRGIHGGGR